LTDLAISDLSETPNARPELLPEADATQERTLEAVSSRPLFGLDWKDRI
jgi:hypothetical protein